MSEAEQYFEKCGGPAYPQELEGHAPGGGTLHCTGLSARDYFAAAALTGILSRGSDFLPDTSATARNAFRYADAMLKARAE